jgi:hypothetical protein
LVTKPNQVSGVHILIDAQVTAFDPESLGVLTKWVKTIKPTKALQK